MAKDTDTRLKFQVLKYINDRSPGGTYKYNLTGRDAPGELELSLGEVWSVDQRFAAARAFEELKTELLIRSTMSGNPDTDNWVAITPAGQEVLATGKFGVKLAEPEEDRSLVADLSSELRKNRPTALIFSDLDNFKGVNDHLGHDGGDRCIDAFKQLLVTIVEERGRVYRRYATGDEFIVVLPNCTATEATSTAERIRRAVESSTIGETVPVTTSLGVYSSDIGPVTDPTELINFADKMMYAAKQTKNAVAFPESPLGVVAAHKLYPELERWMEESISRWADVAHERISAANPMAHYLAGTWCLGYFIAERRQVDSGELLRVLREMPGQTRCMQPWHVPSSHQRKPYPFSGVLECWPEEGENGYSRKFWRASPQLKMFYLQTYDEDDDSWGSEVWSAGTQILMSNPTWRIGECALHASRLSKALGLSSGTVAFHVVWNKLRGRTLTAELSRTPNEKYQSRQDSVQSTATIGIS